jgi:hypothetical protein
LKHRDFLGTAAAFLLYLILSLVLFDHSGDWTGHYLGTEMDPITFIWFIHWWSFAIAHGLNPSISHFVWAPQGDNLTWRTAVPMAALATLPVTLLGGPVLSFNLLGLLAPALSAGSAFLLARYLTRDWAAALLGGFFFGFSSYENGHVLGGGINLTLTFAIPLIVLLCVRRARSELRCRPFIILLTLLILIELGLSTEILLTCVVFGAIVLAVFLFTAPSTAKPNLYRLMLDIGFAGLLAGVVAAPFLYFIIVGLPAVPTGMFSATDYSTDLLNYILPTALTRIVWPAFAPAANAFTATKLEQGAYLGAPLLFLMAYYFIQNRSLAFTRALFIALIILVFASLGPALQVAGRHLQIPLPGRLAVSMPLLNDALPCRLTMYVSLISAIVVACFLALPGKGRPWRYLLAAIAAIFLLPNPARFAWPAWPLQPFFTSPNIARVIGSDRTVILLPFWINGPGMAWQLQAGMTFKQAGGYTGNITPTERTFPIVNQFLAGEVWPGFNNDLTAYCATHKVDDILLGPGASPAIVAAISAMGWQQHLDHGVLAVKLPPASSLAYAYIQGDYWPWAASSNWMGRQVTVITHGMPATLVLTGTPYGPQPLIITQTGPSGRRRYLLGSGKVQTIQVAADTTLKLVASATFVPQNIIHNGDIRHLSVQISLQSNN